MVGHFLGLLLLAGMVLEQREAAHTVLRTLPTIATSPGNLGWFIVRQPWSKCPSMDYDQRFIRE